MKNQKKPKAKNLEERKRQKMQNKGTYVSEFARREGRSAVTACFAFPRCSMLKAHLIPPLG